MNCEQAQRLIDEAAASVEMVAHVEACAECRVYADQNERIESLIRESAATSSEAPDAAVRLAMDQSRAGRARRRALRIGIGSSAAAVIVLAVIMGLGRGPTGETRRAKAPAMRDTTEKTKRDAPKLVTAPRKKDAAPAPAKVRQSSEQAETASLDLLERIVELTLAVSDAESDAERLPLYHTMAGTLVDAFGQRLEASGAADAELTRQYVRILEGVTPLVARLRSEGRTEGFDGLYDRAGNFERTLQSAKPLSEDTVGAALAATRAYREALNPERSQG